MKKIAKLSLVAAVAVAGLTTANAQPLEEAIKNVDVSGSVVYRYNDYSNDSTDTVSAGNKDGENNYKIGLNLSSKVNDDVKFNSRIIAGSQGNGSFVTLNTDSGDGQADISLSNAYFGYTGIQNTTVNVGKQGLTTPWTVAVDSDNNEQTGTGILALSTVGPVTLAAAYFNQSNLDSSSDAKVSALGGETKLTDVVDGGKDIVTVGAIANLDFVTLDAWYLDLDQTFDSYTIGAKADFDLSGVKLGVDARYASLSLDDTIQALGLPEDNAIAKIALTGKVSIVNAKVLYAWTDKDGGLTAADNDAVTTVNGWNTTVNGKADADYWQTTLGVNILSNLNLSANYNNLQYTNIGDAEMEEEELYAQLTYKMSKNFSTYIRYGTYTKEIKNAASDADEINDDTRGRLQVEYTF
ncbi:major outer membrane protein [Arcobacter sp. L]|uniref:major outer membrane protein n=1 Tax=Arcobacter sp. L TaxID=944547 RepID=UPI0002296618|nr:major outer membrane protein [Arcobacter sp. L]BAK74437.1 major outer membrane protein [Arcobacter sp. L]